MRKLLICAIISLVVALYAMYKQVHYANSRWESAVTNVKAYQDMLDSTKKQNRVFELTVDQLKSSNDSIMIKLNDTKRQLKIKDKNLQALQYVASDFTRTDTVILKDTLFKEPSLEVDTMVGDAWYNLRLNLKYPSTIVASPKFKSEKHIVVSSKRETINPPKKFFLLRWFQKKHTLLKVDVVERNPYVQEENNRFIEILR